MFRLQLLLIVFVGVFTSRSTSASLVINIHYSGDSQYKSAFDAAKTTWESLLVGYQDGYVVSTSQNSSATMSTTLTSVNIAATIEAIDGRYGILGSAGPNELAIDGMGFNLTTDGSMRFDSADIGTLSTGDLNSLILHEMAHVLGFGTLWELNNKYESVNGKFTGAQATALWHSEFGQLGTPDVELGGGSGTAGGHWNEVDGGGGLTGITDALGRDMRDELMTGWLNPNSFISNMTLSSFADIGFVTNPAALSNATAVPEPASFAVVASLGGILLWKRRRFLAIANVKTTV